MFESVYSDADVKRLTVRARLRQTTTMNRYAPLPGVVIAASLVPSEAARVVETAIARSEAAKPPMLIDPVRFRVPLQRSRLLFLAGRISASVAGSNIYLKIEASPVLWLVVIGSVAGVAVLAARGWTATAIAGALSIATSLAFARGATFRLLERIALSLPEGQPEG